LKASMVRSGANDFTFSLNQLKTVTMPRTTVLLDTTATLALSWLRNGAIASTAAWRCSTSGPPPSVNTICRVPPTSPSQLRTIWSTPARYCFHSSADGEVWLCITTMRLPDTTNAELGIDSSRRDLKCLFSDVTLG